MIRYPRFKTHLDVLAVVGVGVLLHSEKGQAVLRGRLYELVAPLIDGRRSVDDLVDQLDGRLSAAEVYHVLRHLETKDYLAEGKGPVPNRKTALNADEVRDRVRDLYREVDRDVAAAGPVCVASGRCCRFKEYGHTLFVSNLEAHILLDNAPAYERPVSPDFCPFQKNNLCTAREPRPLGCRIFYCDPSYQEASNQIRVKYLRRLKELAHKLGVEYYHATLHHFLNAPEEAGLRRALDDKNSSAAQGDTHA
jgi:hypothetical protein